MTKNVFNILCSIIIGLIVGFMAVWNDKNTASSVSAGLIAALLVYIALLPAIFAKIRHICCDLDWADETAAAYARIPAPYRKSFWLLFGLINLAFLFHTVNFMWGGQDWAAVRSAVNPDEGYKNGRFAAFWLQELLFDGKILPVANNLWAFLGLSLAGVLLAVYWNLPPKAAPITVIGLFFAVTPYTMSWMYSAQNTLGILWLPALSLLALLLAETPMSTVNRTYMSNLISVLLFVWALGTFSPVLNFILIAVLGKILLSLITADIGLKMAFLQTRQSFANLMAALMLYFLLRLLLAEIGLLPNLYLSVSFISCWLKIPAMLQAIVTQFITPLPFMDLAYKIMQFIIVLTALFSIIFKTPRAKTAANALALLPLILLASRLTSLFTPEWPDAPEHLAHVEFFSLPLFYALMLASVLKLGGKYLRRTGYTLAILLIFMGFVRVAYAQKVWKFGWDAETKLAERLITRLEKLPGFNITHQYKLLQIGEMSLRKKYYLAKPYEQPSDMLLDMPYYPAGAAKDAYNFYYQTDFLNADASFDAAQIPAIREYILNTARAWPAPQSLWIYDDFIIMVLDETALEKMRDALR